MTSTADSIYCSGLLPVLSVEAIEAERGAPLPDMIDPADDPEMALIKKQDEARFHAWAKDLPPGLREVAEGKLEEDETNAEMARRLGVSGAAMTKRMRRIGAIGRDELDDLKDSPLLG